MEIRSAQSFIDYYEKVRSRTLRLLEVIQPEHLDFSYKPGKFTVGDQIRHIAAIERYMYGETIAGRRSAYQGCGKELADGYDNILKYFNEMHRQTIDIISRLSDEDLYKKCLTPANQEITIWKWLRAMLEHEIHHRGELYIYLNLLDVKTPQIYGFSAEEVQEMSVKIE
ncbi:MULTISPECIES: DinB family protein [Chryseobacterium]|uniref:DinB family protein n=1 Tax=Chryseobacterium TaxID=59732 RepID=UPI0015567CE1|nr:MULTISPECIES: DinB family protein [unclassified Chryseobacterium]MDC8103466.1 DinB family protein [Chryseobacterium sp. B21-037]MDQ1803019.1 DinB family protein [Chryseobacterium sp. CKR4-1]